MSLRNPSNRTATTLAEDAEADPSSTEGVKEAAKGKVSVIKEEEETAVEDGATTADTSTSRGVGEADGVAEVDEEDINSLVSVFVKGLFPIVLALERITGLNILETGGASP